jgi:ankyrin repeat protein
MADVFSLARNNRYDALKQLAANGDLPVEVRDAKGNTLLLVACQNGLKRLVKLLLRHGADINAQNNAGNTALHFCHMYGFASSLGNPYPNPSLN